MLLIVVALIFTIFSGCLEPTNKSNLIEIIDYEIKQASIGSYTVVEGTARNKADEMLTVSITGRFYDENKVYLGNDYQYLGSKNSNYKVPAGYSWNFEICFSGDNRDKIESVEFNIKVS